MRFFTFSFVLLVTTINVTIACECGIEGTVSRIFKGNLTRANKYPWLAHIRYRSTRQSNQFLQCGGVLIDEKHVVTAAHCVINKNGKVKSKSNFDVFLGRILALSGHSKPFSVSKIWFDPEFDGETLAHDFAILTLSKSVKYSKTVGPICLPNSEDNLSKLIITGWGKTSKNGASSDLLMEAEVDYINKNDCNEMKKYNAMRVNGYPKFMKDSVRVAENADTLFCAINKKTYSNICQGDSGGPIMHKGTNGRYYLMGTISGLWGECGEEAEDVTGLFTRVYYYKETIKSIAPNACWQD